MGKDKVRYFVVKANAQGSVRCYWQPSAQLEAEGVVVGEPYSTRPVRHAYRLTAAGADLAGPVRMLAGWGAHRHGDVHRARGSMPVHARCGTALEARWFCSTCDEVVEPGPAAEPGPPAGRGDEGDLVWL